MFNMFQYTKSGWGKIDSILDETLESIEESLEEAGFFSVPQISVGGKSEYHLTVYSKIYSDRSIREPVYDLEQEYDFLASLDIGCEVYFIAIPTLPDFVLFMNEVTIGIKNIAELVNIDK